MEKKEYSAIGYHTLIDLSGCNSDLLNDAERLEAILHEVANRIGATIVRSVMHPFAPIGVSGVLVIAESHITIHTWPEHGYAALDFFTCGQKMDIQAGLAYLKVALGAEKCETREFERGAISKEV
jgi:S-adenosylmethionine decarboxylase proenzyme